MAVPIGLRAVATVLIALLWRAPLPGMNPAAAQRATELYQKKDWTALANVAAQATRADSKDGWAWYYSGLADDGLGRRAAAAAAYEVAVKLVPDSIRGSIVQSLAQDNSALKQSGKLIALFQEMQKSHPELAESLQSQFRDVLGKQAAPSAALPEVSPRTLAAVTANVQRTWPRDAIPVMVDISHYGGGFRVVSNFFSPSTKAGLSVVQISGATTNLPVANPNWGQSAIPGSFLSLDAAISRAPAEGAPGTLEHALLRRTGGDAEATDLVWELAMKSGRTAEIAAYIMPRDRFDRVLSAAKQGDPKAQLAAAQVYALGVAGPPDPGQAFKWCTQSAGHGNVEAENMLGQMYEFGRGTRANEGLAVRWYQMAANAGFAPGEYNLGLMFETGRGVGQSYSSAQLWIGKAAQKGLEEAQGELPYVTARAKGQQDQQARAVAANRPQKCPLMYHWEPFIKMCGINLGLVPTIK